MGFVCPECLHPGTLEIDQTIELDSDSRSDEINLQIVECSECRFRGVAVYEESRRGSLDSECVDHYGYRVEKADLESLIDLISRCPCPQGGFCSCPSHQALNRTDPSGRWSALSDLKTTGHFPMRLVTGAPAGDARRAPRAGRQEAGGSVKAFSSRFVDALAFAARLHRDQVRKGTQVPYVAHLLGAASIALEHGADEDAAIAALLHDAVEDQGGAATLEAIRERFGDAVAEIVAGCTDDHETPKPPWRRRKEAYVAHIAQAPASVRLVSAADKLHNARAILSDYRTLGESLWSRFSGGKEGTLWYYRSLVTAFRSAGTSPLVEELDLVVSEIERLASSGTPERNSGVPHSERSLRDSLGGDPTADGDGGSACRCLDPQCRYDAFEDTKVGVDMTNGRYGEVSLRRCRECNRLWLHYHVEYEAFSGSGRWHRGLIAPEIADRVTAENAVALLDSLPWRLRGGSYFGTAGERTTRPCIVQP